MPKCDLDDCSLTGAINEIKTGQNGLKEAQTEMNTTQKVFIQKMDDYVERGKEEHEILFARTRLTVKWPHLATAVFILSAIVGMVWKLASGG